MLTLRLLLGLAKTATARVAMLARRNQIKRAIVHEVRKVAGKGDIEDDSLLDDTIPFHLFCASALDYHRLIIDVSSINCQS